MKVFLSWSGERSKYVAETLSNWLEQVLQALEPWVSSDIEKGKRWDNEISKKLEHSKVAIICLTKENLDSTWIHFEAGAISKTSDAYVCTFLLDITPANVKEPLSLFQATMNTKEDIFKLIKTINSLLDDNDSKSLKEISLESVFNTFWPQLEEKLANVPSAKINQKNVRSDRELIEETLQIVRSLKESSRGAEVTQTINVSPSGSYSVVKEWLPKFCAERNISIADAKTAENIADFAKYLQENIQYRPTLTALRIYFNRLLNEMKE